MPDEPKPPPMRVVHKGWNTREETVETAEVARAFNEWTPDRGDLEIAALRARIAELEEELRLKTPRAWLQAAGRIDDMAKMWRTESWPNFTAIECLEAAAAALRKDVESYSAGRIPDPRDATIAVLEAALRECRGLFIRVRDDWHEAEVVASEGFTAIDRALGEPYA